MTDMTTTLAGRQFPNPVFTASGCAAAGRELDQFFDVTAIGGVVTKSIMLDALGLTLGDRADSSVVRIGADKADILASFDLDDIPDARTWLAERDLDNDGPCILRRVITAEGRSRGYINGTPCPQGDLKALGELLIDIHSQHEHQSLLKLDTQGFDLAAFRGAGPLVQADGPVVAVLSEVACLPIYDGVPLMAEHLQEYAAAGWSLAGLYPVSFERASLRVIEHDAVLVRTPPD